jgi:Fic family protein
MQASWENVFRQVATTSKYAKTAKCSEDSALRDIRQLMESGVLIKNESGGRSTSYTLVLGTSEGILPE